MENGKKTTKPDVLIKRNNEAPGFSSSLTGNRGQLIIERYIQQQNIDLDDYIQNERVLNILIPVNILRQWYPGPNWKKDLAKVCSAQIRDMKEIKMRNGNFKMMRLIAYAELSDEGLLLSVLPQVLHYYLVGPKSPYVTSIEYNITTQFSSRFSHEIYWEICKHDNPREQYTFFITPKELNERFETKYNVTNIVKEILQPTQEEIKMLYDQNLSPRYFTYNEKREQRKIVGWELKVHNIDRENKERIKTKECYLKIDECLQRYVPQYKLNILSQIRSFNYEQMTQLWLRLEKFDHDNKSGIRSLPAYVCTILQHYGIKPYSNKKDNVKTNTLFEKEEEDTAKGLAGYFRVMTHINNSKSISSDVKNLFNTVKFYSFSEKEDGYLLTLRLSTTTYQTIKTYFSGLFHEIMMLYFPNNTDVKYYIND